MSFREVVESNNDGAVNDANVALNTHEEILGEVLSIPRGKWLTETLAELVKGGLSEERHRHLAVPNVEIESARAMPSESLAEVEKLFAVPSVGILFSEGGEFITILS